MPDFFDKVKEKVDQGISLVASKSKETIETAKLHSRIRSLRHWREEKIKDMGNLVFNMLQEGRLDEQRLKEAYSHVVKIDDEIKNMEKEIERIKLETEQTIRATPTPAKAFVYCTCGTGLTETSKFCGDCGANVVEIIARAKEELAKQAICDHCGAQLSLTAKFCKKCGSPVKTKTRESTEDHLEKQEISLPREEEEKK